MVAGYHSPQAGCNAYFRYAAAARAPNAGSRRTPWPSVA